MKRFIEVEKRMADGRTITQRYPARSVGLPERYELITWSERRAGGWVGDTSWDYGAIVDQCGDVKCLSCGYHVCSQAGPSCSPFPDHERSQPSSGWHAAPDGVSPGELCPSLQAAMERAEQLAEPEHITALRRVLEKITPDLRPGWTLSDCALPGRAEYRFESVREVPTVFMRHPDDMVSHCPELPWRVFGHSNHATLDEAMQRAEQLAAELED